MNITPTKTDQITTEDTDLFKIIDRYLPPLKERSIVVITSKIVSIAQQNTVLKTKADKQKLIESEADVVLGNNNSQNFVITLKNGVLMPTAGVDPSGDIYIMLPKDAYKSARDIADYLRSKYALRHLGVIITDSKSTVLRRGTLGYAVGYSGFCGLKNYDDPHDAFITKKKRRKLVNRVDALAGAAVAVMGDGKEQTPLAVINDLPFIAFNPSSPSKIELTSLHIKPSEDLFITALAHLGKK